MNLWNIWSNLVNINPDMSNASINPINNWKSTKVVEHINKLDEHNNKFEVYTTKSDEYTTNSNVTYYGTK